MWIFCHILYVNIEGQTYFPRKRIRYSENKVPVHQTFMCRTILGVKPTPKNTIITDIYENRYQHKKYLNYYSVNTVSCSNICILFKKLTFLGNLHLTCLLRRGPSYIWSWLSQAQCYKWYFFPENPLYRVSQEECARLWEGVPYAKLYRYNPKHLSPKWNGYGDNGQRSLKL